MRIWSPPNRYSVSVALCFVLGLITTVASAAPTFVFGPQEYRRSTGQPVRVSRTFVATEASNQYLLRISNFDVSSAVVTLNGQQVFGPSDFEGKPPRLERQVALRSGNNTLIVELRGAPGSRLAVEIEAPGGTDITPPTISATASPAPNASGWNNSDVTLTFACADSGSGIATCPAPVTVTNEAANQVVSGTAVDNAGNKATASVTLSIDKTAPVVTAAQSPAANAAGWNNTPVVVTFSATDSLSGVPAGNISASVTLAAEGENQSATGQATDRAGNTSTATHAGINIDRTNPEITASLIPEPNAGGIVSSAVTVHFACADSGSGIAACPPDQLITAPGPHAGVSGTATDRAGNSASATTSSFIIQTGTPTITSTVSPAPNGAGWNNTPVTVHFTCMEAGYPLDGCPADVVVSTEGAGQTVTGTVTDGAGNTASVTTDLFNIDLQKPSITVALSPAPGAGGWNNSPVTAQFVCGDTGSGVASCPPDQVVTTEGVYLTVTGTATDLAGNAAVITSPQFRIDSSPPFVTVSLSPSPNANGWNNSPVTAHFTCVDAASGVATCPADRTISADGTQTITDVATDNAGNSNSAAATLNLDQTPPVLNFARSSGTVTVPELSISGTASDSLSGLRGVTCNGVPAAVAGSQFQCETTLNPGANSITATATDAAGNTTSSDLSLNYLPQPKVTITSPANLSYFNISPTTVSGTVDDATATVTINSIPAPVSGGFFSIPLPLAEGPNIITATATAASGTVSTDTIEVTLDTTPPHVTITSPADGFITTDGAISIAGNVNDIVVGTVNDQQAQVSVNGASASVSNRTFLAANVPLSLGPNTIQAIARDRVGNSVTTQISVIRQAPAAQPRIHLVSGNGQTGVIGSALGAPLVIELMDGQGNPVPSKPVIFKVTQNDGIISSGGDPATTVIGTTNGQGRAEARWTLGHRAGAGGNVVEAYSVGFEGTAIFTASGGQGEAGKIVVDTGNDQIGAIGQALPKPFIAVVVDGGNNRLAGVPVTFTVQQGGGSFDGAPTLTTTSDSDGRVAATLTLGLQEGSANNLVEANFALNAGAPAGFTASGRAPGNAADTTISGVVLDNSNQPIEGVTVRAVLTNVVRSNLGAVQAATAVETDTHGVFTIPQAPVGLIKLMVDGTTAHRDGTYPSLEYDLITVAGHKNDVGQPIYLLPLNTNNQLCVTQTTGGGTLTIPEAPGFSLTFGPGQVTFPGGAKSGCISVTVVNGDKVPMVPGFGQQPRFIVTIQPAGAVFNPPAPITLPNVDGLKPRAVTEMYSFDHDIGSFVAIGTGVVSDDGRVIRSSAGVGVLKAGWHCGGDPAANGTVADCGACHLCVNNKCQVDDSQVPAGPPTLCNKLACQNGSVINQPDNSQTPPQNSPNDCKKETCSAGGVTSVNDDSEIPTGTPPVCKKLECSGGAAKEAVDPAQDAKRCVDGATVGICKLGACTPAIPINFRQTGTSSPGGGTLHFDYAWDSSTGSLADLSKCTISELVSYPGGNPYIWPSPPWNGGGTANPTNLSVPATDGVAQDNHSTLGFLKPYTAASFTASQDYRYTCTDVNGGNPVLIESHAIVRSVSQNPNGSWKYVITKSGASNSINPLP